MLRALVLVPAPDYPEAYDWAFDIEAQALRDSGFTVEARPWTEAGDEAGFDVVLPLVVWGYHVRPAEWAALLDRWEAAGSPVLNPPSLLRWNSDKAYLEELGAIGVPTIPTRKVAALDEAALAEARADFGGTLVIKPPVSAAADGTYLVGSDDALPEAARGRPMMIQPFCPAVQEEGEYSLIFFSGRFSHALVKRPKVGDYRVQPHLGGREVACEPPAGALAVAEAALTAAPARPAYARVDLLRAPDGDLKLIELELVEPSLWLNLKSGASAAFAAAIRDALP